MDVSSVIDALRRQFEGHFIFDRTPENKKGGSSPNVQAVYWSHFNPRK
jgi:hypothetical protein